MLALNISITVYVVCGSMLCAADLSSILSTRSLGRSALCVCGM